MLTQATHPAGGAPSAEIDCSILVPTYNEERYIARSVEAMCAQRFDGVLEVVVADGGSTDATRDILRRLSEAHPEIVLLDNPRRSVSSGLNVALSHARGTWVARMDAHTIYPPDYLARGIARLRRGGTRWVSGPQQPEGEGRVSTAVSLALAHGLGRGGSRKWGTGEPGQGAEYLLDTGVFAGVWRRSTLLDYGGWDERWEKNEDSEMAARFLANGERLVCLPEMAAVYSPRDTVLGLARQYRGYGRYRFRTARRHPHSLRRSLLLPPATTAMLAGAVLAPKAVRPAARTGGFAYLLLLSVTAARSRSRAASSSDAALVALVLAVMHLSFGAGFIEEAVRDDVLGTVFWPATDRPRGDDPAAATVWAPSLVIGPASQYRGATAVGDA